MTEPAANVAPVFSTEFTDRTDAEGAVISFDANATDANPGDTLTYTATNLPNGITHQLEHRRRQRAPSVATSSGSYAVVLTVSDGTLTDTDSLHLDGHRAGRSDGLRRRPLQPDGGQQLGQRHRPVAPTPSRAPPPTTT